MVSLIQFDGGRGDSRGDAEGVSEREGVGVTVDLDGK